MAKEMDINLYIDYLGRDVIFDPRLSIEQKLVNRTISYDPVRSELQQCVSKAALIRGERLCREEVNPAKLRYRFISEFNTAIYSSFTKEVYKDDWFKFHHEIAEINQLQTHQETKDDIRRFISGYIICLRAYPAIKIFRLDTANVAVEDYCRIQDIGYTTMGPQDEWLALDPHIAGGIARIPNPLIPVREIQPRFNSFCNRWE